MMAARHATNSLPPLSELLRDIAAVPALMERAVRGVSLDSRQVRPGSLFLACTGLRSRGHDFIGDAVAQGAVAVVYEIAAGEAPSLPPFIGDVPQIPVVDLAQRAGLIAERFFGEPSRDLFMVGITGTNGKTSCSHYLAQALHSEAGPCGIIG
ncbi:MAG: Mur ligase domain-containing protein, partial [Pseudomonadota bacterium]